MHCAEYTQSSHSLTTQFLPSGPSDDEKPSTTLYIIAGMAAATIVALIVVMLFMRMPRLGKGQRPS